MSNSACAICESPMRGEIEKRDNQWKADKTIQWARKRGVKISRLSLARHRTGHPKSSRKKMNALEKSIEIPEEATSEKVKTDLIERCDAISDLQFLDTVRDFTYKRLMNGEIELKIDSGFKAIELKNKIAEQSHNEKLLLEILAEIRTDELSRMKRPI